MEQIRHNHGYINYLDDEKDETALELRQTWVDEEFRQKGIATEMLKELIGIAKKMGRTSLITYSSTDPETQAFGKFLVANKFIKIKDENNSTGDKWKLTI